MTCDCNKELDEGQIILKGLLVSSNSPKKTNKPICFKLLPQIRSFVFWENSSTTKSPF